MNRVGGYNHLLKRVTTDITVLHFMVLSLTKNMIIEGNKKESHRHIKQSGNSHLLILILILLAISIYCFNLFLDHREETSR